MKQSQQEIADSWNKLARENISRGKVTLICIAKNIWQLPGGQEVKGKTKAINAAVRLNALI